jgi:hypothetical protein
MKKLIVRQASLLCLFAVASCADKKFAANNAPQPAGQGNQVPVETTPTRDPPPPPVVAAPVDPAVPPTGPVVPAQLLPMQFTRLADTARNTNCLYVSINNGAEQLLGCNKGPATPAPSFMVQPKPACNTVRLRMTTNNRQAWTTQNQADVSSFFKPPTILGPGKIRIQCNDNGDKDFNDMNLVMDGLGLIQFTIENSTVPCG